MLLGGAAAWLVCAVVAVLIWRASQWVTDEDYSPLWWLAGAFVFAVPAVVIVALIDRPAFQPWHFGAGGSLGAAWAAMWLPFR